MTSTNIIIITTSYLLGAIPFALILVHFATGKDVRSSGTGNVGASNSYDVSGRKWIGLTVMILDALKAIAAIGIARWVDDYHFTSTMLAVIFVILGHNFNIFLKFKGGRGLASAAGAILIINPLALIIWAFFYIVGFYVIKHDVHIASIFAIVLTPLAIFRAPDSVFLALSYSNRFDIENYKLLILIICFIIMLRHIQPLIEILKKRNL